MKTKIKIIFSSHLDDDKNNIFIKHCINTSGVKTEVYCYNNFNEYSLSEIYNKALKKHTDNNSILIFCHNDIEFSTNNWGKKILNHFNNNHYQIIGVAGTTFLNETARWWDDKTKMIGIVDHTNGIRKWTSTYSNSFQGIKPTTIIDGLFVAIDPINIIHNFDEDFKGFHFYDLGFVFPNVLDGINCGVITNIRILHKSEGITNQQWEKNRKLFIEKYKEELPFNINDYV